MEDIIMMIVFGIVISILSLFNMKGNVSSIHWYHRMRIKKDDVKKYGLLVGAGTLIIGLSLILTGILKMFFSFEWINYINIISLLIWLILFVYAQVKYNKGIF